MRMTIGACAAGAGGVEGVDGDGPVGLVGRVEGAQGVVDGDELGLGLGEGGAGLEEADDGDDVVVVAELFPSGGLDGGGG
jgi:hypothetical protein